MRILTVVGNRPQFIKAAAVSGLLRAAHEEILVHTGQHHDDSLSRVFFSELGLARPDRELGLGGGTNTAQTARMLAALGAELAELRPDAALVYGDTNSTLAGALAAAHALEPGEYLLLTAHRAGNVDPPERLAALVELVRALPLPVLFPLHPRTRARLLEAGRLGELEQDGRVLLTEPLGYGEFSALLA